MSVSWQKWSRDVYGITKLLPKYFLNFPFYFENTALSRIKYKCFTYITQPYSRSAFCWEVKFLFIWNRFCFNEQQNNSKWKYIELQIIFSAHKHISEVRYCLHWRLVSVKTIQCKNENDDDSENVRVNNFLSAICQFTSGWEKTKYNYENFNI